MRGIPPCVKQDEDLKKKQDEVRGTVKAAVLEGDPMCKNLVASSVYDTKPVHYLSMVSSKLKWVLKIKDVFNVDTGKREHLHFLHLNRIDTYNNSMGHVDIADQLQAFYRPDHWVCNRKWWWATWFWALGVIITNAYIVYVKVMEMNGIPKKDILSHHDFWYEIAWAWINEENYLAEKGKLAEKKLLKKMESSKKRKYAMHSNSISSLLNTSASIDKEVTHMVSDESLNPLTGKLQCRLLDDLDHLPVEKIGRARCQLHCWAAGDAIEKNIIHCPSCKVHLCIKCYRLFHKQRRVSPEDLLLDNNDETTASEQSSSKKTKTKQFNTCKTTT